MLKEQLDYSNEKFKQLKALYEERLKVGKNLDYKKQYEDKNKELLQMKSEYAEALSCLREETQSREKFETLYKTVKDILEAEDLKRNDSIETQSEYEDKEESSQSESENETEEDGLEVKSDVEDEFDSYGNTHGRYVRAPSKRAMQESQYKCATCDQTFESEKDLKLHIFRVHKTSKYEKSEGPWKVVKNKKRRQSKDTQENKIPNSNELNKNQLNESHQEKYGERMKHSSTYECDQCNKSFKQMGNLRKHNMNWHEELSCYICQKTISSKKEIMKHKAVYHNMKIRDCSYFLQGLCRDGEEECIYSHGINTTPKQVEAKTQNKNRERCPTENCKDQRCKLSHFMRSRNEIPCRYGDQCNREVCDFIHKNKTEIKVHMKGFHIKQKKHKGSNCQIKPRKENKPKITLS